VRALQAGEQPVIYGDGEQSRDFTYISNVVDANLRAAESSAANGKTINIGNGESVTINELLQTLKELTGKQSVTAEYRGARAGDVRHSLADLSLAESVLGYTSRVGLEEGLRLTLDWWKNSRFGVQTKTA
jgi:UDP-glucose 4-epimerase